MAHPAAERHDPAIAFHRQHESDAHLARRFRGDYATNVAVEMRRQTLEGARGVADADLHFFNRGPAIPELIEPFWRLRSAPAGVNDEISQHARLGFSQLLHANAAHHPVFDQQSHNPRVIDDMDVRQLQHTTAQRALEQRTAEKDAVEAAAKLRLVVTVLEPADVVDDVARDRADLEEVALEPWKERLQTMEAARQQSMSVMALRNRPAVGNG